MNFWQLWKKELSGLIWKSAFFVALFIVLVDLVFGRRKNVLWVPDDIHKLNLIRDWESPFGIPWTPLIVLTLWGIGMAFYTLQQEWSSKSIFLLKSLPVKGYQVLGAKLAGIASGVMAVVPFSVGIYLLTWYEKLAQFKPPVPTMVYFGFIIVLCLLTIIIYLATIVQFAFLTGRLVSRFRFIISIISIFFVLKFLDILGIICFPLLKRIPDLVLRFNIMHFKVDVWFFWGTLLATIALFFVNCWLYERIVEL
jgi:hypothetical protein